ncbi:MAG TPA: hypothetical protein VLH16_06770, partial [Bacteroidales bacterium]|nr:hypothetical protein [Bacteroidales bacterium]
MLSTIFDANLWFRTLVLQREFDVMIQKTDIEKIFKEIYDHIGNFRIADAIRLLEKQCHSPGLWTYRMELSELSNTYQNLLKYTLLGVADPKQKDVYNNLICDLYEYSDIIRHKLLEQSGMQIFSIKKELDRTSRQLMQNISDLGERNLINWSQEINYPDLEQLAKNSTSDSPNRQTLLRSYFNWIWLCDKLSEHDSLILRKLIDSESIFWYEKCLFISALTLGLLKGFDQRRFEILLEIHE